MKWEITGFVFRCLMCQHQGRALEASRLAKTTRISTMEVGTPHEGFHFVNTIDQETQQCNLGDYRPLNEVSSIHSNEDREADADEPTRKVGLSDIF